MLDGKVERRLAGEDCLPGHGRDGRYPGEHGAFAKAEARSLVRENVAEHDPLIEGDPVHDDERYLVFGALLEPPCEVARYVMDHHRRVGRLVVQARVATFGPCEEGPIHAHPQLGNPRASSPSCVGALPSPIEGRPALPSGRRTPSIRGGALRGLESCRRPVSINAPRRRNLSASGSIRSSTFAHSSRRALPASCDTGDSIPLDEQVVDVDANVVVIEGEVGGPFDLEVERTVPIPRAVAGVSREASEKEWPAFPQEREEGVPIRHDDLEGPGVECPATPEQLNQVVIQDARQFLRPGSVSAGGRAAGRPAA